MPKTKIEWAETVWNPVTGCTNHTVNEDCRNCYAHAQAIRFAGSGGYPADNPFQVQMHEKRLSLPSQWKKRRIVFVCSMGEMFHEDVSFDFLDEIFKSMLANPQHIYLILTKESYRMQTYVSTINHPGCNSNTWFGISAGTQGALNHRVKPLITSLPLNTFVSLEPLIKPVDISEWIKLLDWVIVGGESRSSGRPMNPLWVLKIREQCKENGVPFFFKQWGEWGPVNREDKPAEAVFNLFPDAPEQIMYKIGKKHSGRDLFGVEYDEYPIFSR